MLDEAVRRVQGSHVPWDELRATRGERRATEAFRGRGKPTAPRAWVYALAGAAGLASLLLFFLVAYPRLASTPAVAVLQKSEHGASTFQLLDGSRVHARADARLEFKRVEPQAVEVAQHAGHVRYEVAQQPERVFSVSVRGVLVRVLGTVFEVSVSAGQVDVVVTKGRVEVRYAERRFLLADGERLTLDTLSSVPPTGPGSAPDVGTVKAPGPVLSAQPTVPDASAAKLASAEELLEQADQARRVGQAAEAVAKLKELIQRFPRNPRVALAWFTLGRIETSRGQPTQAARAFEKCVALRPAGALGEDCTAEWARSLKRTGDASGAGQVAERYLRTYPEGIHRDTLRSMVFDAASAPAK